MPANISVLLNTIKSKIQNIKGKHPKYILSTDAIKGDLSIEYTEIPLKKPCKSVDVYYSGECVYSYRKLIHLYQSLANNNILLMMPVSTQLELLITGWASGKVVSSRNIQSINNMIEARATQLKIYHNQFDELYDQFMEKNVDDETEMVDCAEIVLYKNANSLPYKKVYRHFFKKDIIGDNLAQTHIKTDMDILDTLLHLMNILYRGYEKVGKGDQYEKWRAIQRALILLVDSFATILEKDIQLYEKFQKLNETVIAFKVYPHDPNKDELKYL